MYYSRYYHHPKFMGIRLWFPEDKFKRRLCKGLLIFIALVLFVILVIYLALRPHKPRFYVQDALIRQLNLTTDGTLTSSLQFTIISHNPNDRIGIYYDRITAYATYMTQQITSYIPLTPFYQGDNDDTTISAVLNGSNILLAPFVVERLRGEQNGVLPVNVRVGGEIRWKVGTWTSGDYHLNVNCFALMGLNGAQLPEDATCHVSV